MNDKIKFSMLKYRANKLIQERVNQLTIGEYRNLKRLMEQEQQLPYDPNMPPPPPPPAPPMDPNMMAPPQAPMDPAMAGMAPPEPPMDPSMMGGAPPMDPSMGMGGMGMGGMAPPPAGPKKLKIFQEELPESIKKLLKLPEYVPCKLSMKYGTNAVMNCIERIDYSKKIND
jgi:hypothetical protein